MKKSSVNLSLLKEVCEVPGPAGFEKKIRELVIKEAKKYSDKVYIDNIGNVIAYKKGTRSDSKIMIAAHMDEIGFIISHIDERGFLRFHPLGGFDPKTLTAQRVIVHGKKDLLGVMGCKPTHLMTEVEKTKAPALTDFFIDLGLPKEEVVKYVQQGDPVSRERELIQMGNNVNCKSIDNRICVYALIDTLKNLKKHHSDVYAVFTVQEEIGSRGAIAATLAIQPDYSFCLDTTIAFDLPGAKPEEAITYLGQGAAIKIIDAGVVCDYRMVDFMKKTADKYKIKWQPEVLPKGSTDASGMQKMTAGGSITGAISIPTRHLHQVIEMANLSDVENSVLLLCKCIEEIHTFSRQF